MNILNYSLVHWEDAEASTVGWLQVGALKEGTLLYKSHDSYFGFGVPVWKTCYALLRLECAAYWLGSAVENSCTTLG